MNRQNRDTTRNESSRCELRRRVPVGTLKPVEYVIAALRAITIENARNDVPVYILVGSLALIGFLLGLNISATYSTEEALKHDASVYWEMAQEFNRSGLPVPLISKALWKDLGYPMVLSAVTALFGANVRAAQVANVVMFSLSCGFFFLALRRIMALLGSPVRATLQVVIASSFFFSPLFLTFSGKLYSEIFSALGITAMLCAILYLWHRGEVWSYSRFGDGLWSVLLVIGSVAFFVTKSVFFPLLGVYLIAFWLLRKRLLFFLMLICFLLVLPFQASAQLGGRGQYNFAIQISKLEWSYREIGASSVYNLSNTLGQVLLPEYEYQFYQFSASEALSFKDNPPLDKPRYDRNPYVMAQDLSGRGFSYLDGFQMIMKDPLRYIAVVMATLPAVAFVEGAYPDVTGDLPYVARMALWVVLKLGLSSVLWFGAVGLLVRKWKEPIMLLLGSPFVVFVLMYGNYYIEQRWFFPLLPVLWLLALAYILMKIPSNRNRRNEVLSPSAAEGEAGGNW